MNATSSDLFAVGVVWSLVEDGFHVGSRDGEFLGFIERRNGVHHAFDLYSRPVGSFSDLPSAMRAVTGARPVIGVRPR